MHNLLYGRAQRNRTWHLIAVIPWSPSIRRTHKVQLQQGLDVHRMAWLRLAKSWSQRRHRIQIHSYKICCGGQKRSVKNAPRRGSTTTTSVISRLDSSAAFVSCTVCMYIPCPSMLSLPLSCMWISDVSDVYRMLKSCLLFAGCTQVASLATSAANACPSQCIHR
jgi:hypothetical protein